TTGHLETPCHRPRGGGMPSPAPCARRDQHTLGTRLPPYAPWKESSAWSPRLRSLDSVLDDCSRSHRPQLGVLAGLRVQLSHGLLAPSKNRPRCRRATSVQRFHPARVAAHHRQTKGGKGTAAAASLLHPKSRRR